MASLRNAKIQSFFDYGKWAIVLSYLLSPSNRKRERCSTKQPDPTLSLAYKSCAFSFYIEIRYTVNYSTQEKQ